MTGTGEQGRVVGLDGIRGLAALYVALFHCWLLTFHGFPANPGPVWLGWLLYGHLAVVLFLVLSGFSLSISPARHGWQLGGAARFAWRRALRILPAYWAALAFSLVIAWTVLPQPHSGPPTGRTVLVYGLLLQDIFVAPVPNGAFWSIAVEAELYVVFPLLLLLRRRTGVAVTLAVVTVPVLAIGLHHPDLSTVDRLTGLTPQLAPLFTMGMLAAGATVMGTSTRRVPWHWLAALAAVPVVVLILVTGSVWTVHHYFWVDLAAGPALALFLAAVATGRTPWLARLLATRPLRGLGTISYSLYLVHLPIVLIVSREVVGPLVHQPLPAFAATVALAVPVSVAAAWLFATVFEIPMQRLRGATAPSPRASAAPRPSTGDRSRAGG